MGKFGYVVHRIRVEVTTVEEEIVFDFDEWGDAN